MLLFSATMPPWVDKVVKEYMKEDRVFIDLVKEGTVKASKDVEHIGIPCHWTRCVAEGYLCCSSYVAHVVWCLVFPLGLDGCCGCCCCHFAVIEMSLAFLPCHPPRVCCGVMLFCDLILASISYYCRITFQAFWRWFHHCVAFHKSSRATFMPPCGVE